MKKYFNKVGLFIIAIILFLVFVYDLQSKNRINFMFVGGLHPVSDARGYWNASLLYMATGQLTDWGSRRPIFPIFLSNHVKIFGENISNIQVVLAGYSSIVISLITLVSFNFASWIGAITTLIFLIFYYISFIHGTLMSESLGLLLGSISTILLINEICEKKNKHNFFSLFITSLSQVVRPGPLLILPILATWFALKNKATSKFVNLLLNFFAILLPFIISSILTKILAQDEQIPFANLASTLYGLAHGGIGWAEAYNSHPEFKQMSETQIAKVLYIESFHFILNNPFSFVRGIGITYLYTFLYGGVFIVSKSFWVNRAIPILLVFSMCIPIFSKSTPYQKLLSVISMGILLSLPACTDGGFRVMAAVAPFLSLIIYQPFSFLSSRVYEVNLNQFLYNFVKLKLLLLCIIVFLSFRKHSVDNFADNLICKEGQKKIKILPNSGTFSHISNSSKEGSIELRRWRNSIDKNIWEKEMVTLISSINSNNFILSNYDYISNNLLWILIPDSIELKNEMAMCVMCDKIVQDFCIYESQ